MNRTSSANRSSENATASSTLVPYRAEGIAWCSVFILISVFTVAGNLLNIVLFVLDKNLRKRSLFLVINMAFADLLIGALSLPGFVFIIGSDYQRWPEASAAFLTGHRIIDTVFSQVALISAASISVERFFRHILAVQAPNTSSANISHCSWRGVDTSCRYLRNFQRIIKFNFIQTYRVCLDTIYLNSYTCYMWLSFRHLEKVSSWKGRFTAGKQTFAKQTFNKDFDACIYSCFAVVDTFNYFILFRHIKYLDTWEIF